MNIAVGAAVAAQPAEAMENWPIGIRNRVVPGAWKEG